MPVFVIQLFALLLALLASPSPRPLPSAAIDVEHYRFSLALSDSNNTVRGTASLTVRFRNSGLSSFEIDLVGREGTGNASGMAVTGVTLKDRPVPYEHRNNRLRIRLEPAPASGEKRTFSISYRGVPADGLIIATNKFGERTFFGDNWPDRARHWVPVVDHPSDKATVEWLVTAPAHYQVIANGRLVEETDLPGGHRLTHWRTDSPLPTKVMVVGAARFAVEHRGEVAGVEVQSWPYARDREAGFADFSQADSILAWFTRYIGPYPYEKLANVQSKTIYGGMENASAIFYAESAITGERRNEALLAHEIAHQWFGNAVTEADWPHVWLSEGFATYFEELYREARYGPEALREGMEANREIVVRYSRRAPRTTVVDSTVTDLKELLSPISYQKGSWVLHMLRQEVGDDAFHRGIRRYYNRYRHGNASTADFRTIMEEASGKPLGSFFKQWLYTPLHPVVYANWSYQANTGTVVIDLKQRGNTVFRFPLEIGVGQQVERVMVDEPEERFTFKVARAPEHVVLDPRVRVLLESEVNRR